MYVYIKNNKIFGAGSCKLFNDDTICIKADVNPDNLNMYIYEDNELVINPNYEAEQEQKAVEQRIAEIKTMLQELDAQAVRPLRAIMTDCATDEDKEILKDIETQANALREELSCLL